MKRTLPRIMISLVVMFFSMAALAQETKLDNLVVLLKNGTADSYELAQKPIITYGVGAMNIQTDGVQTSYQLAEVENFHFSSDKTAVESILTDIVFQQSAPNIFTILGSHGAMVYDTAGRMVYSFDEAQQIVVDLNNQSAGVYVITVKGAKKNQSIKILKK